MKKSKIAPSSSPAKRVERTYDAAVRVHCVNLMTPSDNPLSPPPLSPLALSRFPDAPPYETLKRWRREFAHPRAPSQRKGPATKLTLDEQQIMGGYAVFLLQHLRLVDVQVMIDFVATAFNKTVSPWWISTHMHKLGFTSRRPAGRSLKFEKRGALAEAIEFVKQVRPTLLRFKDKRRIVAVDQIAFWDSGMATSCYAPIGR